MEAQFVKLSDDLSTLLNHLLFKIIHIEASPAELHFADIVMCATVSLL